MAVRTRRAVGGDEPGGNASAGRICQRVVSVPDLLSRVPSVESREPSRRSARRRRLGAYRRDRPGDFRQSVRDRASRSRAGYVGERRSLAERRSPSARWASSSSLWRWACRFGCPASSWRSQRPFPPTPRTAMRDGWLLVPLTSKFCVHLAEQAGYCDAAAGDPADGAVAADQPPAASRGASLVRRRERGAAPRGDDGADFLERAADVLQLHLSSDGRDGAGNSPKAVASPTSSSGSPSAMTSRRFSAPISLFP